jgi:hypothetical protein
MSNPFLKDFDDLLEDILTDYANQDPAPDTSQGSMVYIKSACIASMLYGLYRYQDWIANQAFPDTAATAALNHWGTVFGITRQVSDSDQDYLNRVLLRIRKPPAGGNKYDWSNWTQYDVNDNPIYATGVGNNATGAASATGLWVKTSTVIPNAQGVGSVDVVIQPTDMTYIGTTGMEALRLLSYASVDEQRPVTASLFRVLSASISAQTIAMTVIGPAGLDTASMVSDILALISSLKPGDALYMSQLIAICVNDGAISATCVSPGVDMIPSSYQIITAATTPTVTQVG